MVFCVTAGGKEESGYCHVIIYQEVVKMILIKERIGKMLEYLQAQVYPKQVAIPSYKMIRTDERFPDVKNLDTSSWTEITNQELWGGHREYYWFETVVTIPEEFDGECVVYELKPEKKESGMQRIHSFPSF